MIIHDHNIEYGKEYIATRRFIVENPKSNVLILHGAGRADQEKSLSLAKMLADKGYAVTTFDFLSHGRSTGKLSDLNLIKRLEQAETVIKHFQLNQDLIVIGFSMSGQTSIDLIETGLVKSLILFAPAVYAKQARNANFGEESEFTRIIRQKDSWMNSDAWEKLRSFKGKCLIFQAEHDTVIPKHVPGLIHSHAEFAQKKQLVTILGADHRLNQWIIDNPNVAQWFAKAIENFENDRPISRQNNDAVSFRIEFE